MQAVLSSSGSVVVVVECLTAVPPVRAESAARHCKSLSTLSQKSATVAEFCRCLATLVTLFCDSVDRS